MGEEEKRPEEQKVEQKKAEEPKKPEEDKKEEEKEEEEVKPEEEQKDEKKTEESKEAAPAPQPSQEIILRVYMHCEGCARKVRRCLKGFEGVEDVETDCKTRKVVVKGEKADPRKVLARVQRKSHRQVELLSPIPPPVDPKKPEEKEIPKPQEKKEEPRVITVVLKVHMHCEACAQEIKKRIQRMRGVESVEPDLKGSQVTVKGVFEAPKLVEYVYKRTGKHAVIVKQEPEEKEEDKGKEEKKGEEGGDKDEKKGEEVASAAAEADGGGVDNEKKEGGGGGGGEEAVKPEGAITGEQEETNVVELKKNDFYYYYPQNYQIYPPTFATEMYSYYPPAPQMFSDENPNACSVV